MPACTSRAVRLCLIVLPTLFSPEAHAIPAAAGVRLQNYDDEQTWPRLSFVSDVLLQPDATELGGLEPLRYHDFFKRQQQPSGIDEGDQGTPTTTSSPEPDPNTDPTTGIGSGEDGNSDDEDGGEGPDDPSTDTSSQQTSEVTSSPTTEPPTPGQPTSTENDGDEGSSQEPSSTSKFYVFIFHSLFFGSSSPQIPCCGGNRAH